MFLLETAAVQWLSDQRVDEAFPRSDVSSRCLELSLHGELDLYRRVLVCDGAMGTYLYAKGIFINRSYDELNVSQPELIRAVLRALHRPGDVQRPAVLRPVAVGRMDAR